MNHHKLFKTAAAAARKKGTNNNEVRINKHKREAHGTYQS